MMTRRLKIISLTACSLALVSLPASADPAADGKVIYDGKGACFTCHGPTGKGDGIAAAAMDPKPRSFSDAAFLYDTDGDGKKGTDADLKNILKNGTIKYGGSPLMPPRPDLTDEETTALIAYMRSLKAS